MKKKESIRQKTMYIGAGAGIVLFAVFGLMPGSFLGGVMGLSIAGTLLGSPTTPGILTRIIVALSMLVGVLASGLLFTIAGSTLGWILGAVADLVREAKEAPAGSHDEQAKEI